MTPLFCVKPLDVAGWPELEGGVLNSDEIRAPALDGPMSPSQKRNGPRIDDLVMPMMGIERQCDADAATPRGGDRIKDRKSVV